MIIFFFLSAWLPNWIHQLVNRDFFVMIQKSIPCSSTNSTSSTIVMNVSIFFSKFMTIFTMCSISSFFRMLFKSNSMVIISSIICLFFSGSPSAIAWLIITIIIYSINRVIVWPISHVRKEIIKRFSPPIADQNTAPTIIFIILIINIFASLNHLRPSIVNGLFRFIAHLTSFLSRGFIITHNYGEFK